MTGTGVEGSRQIHQSRRLSAAVTRSIDDLARAASTGSGTF